VREGDGEFADFVTTSCQKTRAMIGGEMNLHSACALSDPSEHQLLKH
jgi:hypothetical protein